MNEDETSLLVVDVARDIVGDVAPDELPIFEVSSQAFVLDPDKARGSDDDQMLGFGTGAEFELLTPVVLSITSGVVTYLLKTALEASKAEAKVVVEQRVRLLFKRFRTDGDAAGAAAPPLTHQQLVEVHQVALDIATRMSVPQPQASLLADATVGQLAVAS
jgi:hypothetical protein